MNSEYVGAFDWVKMTLWQGYLDFFINDIEENLPIVFSDNKSAIALSKSSVVTKRSKHINVRYHFLQKYSKNLCFTPTRLQKGDALTKAVDRNTLIKLFYTPPDELNEYDSYTEADDANAHYSWAHAHPTTVLFEL